MMIELKDGTHVIAPCPTGWGIPVSDTVEATREIVDCGLWYLAEYENGEYKINHNPDKFTSVSDYLRKQGILLDSVLDIIADVSRIIAALP